MAETDSKSSAKWSFLAIAGGSIAALPKLVAAIESIGKLQVESSWRWMLHFAGDWLLLCAAVAVLALLPRWCGLNPSAASFAIWRTVTRRQFGVIALLAFVNVGFAVILFPRIAKFYKARYAVARLDTAFVKARDEMWRRRYVSAKRDLDRQGGKLVQAETASPKLSLKDMQDDSIARIQDSEILLRRINDAIRSSSPRFEDVLMLQRAYLLNSELPREEVERLHISQRLTKAIQSYALGVGYLRKGDLVQAQKAVQESRGHIRDFLHQNELLRYIDVKRRSSTEAVDPALMEIAEYYVHQSDKGLETAIRSMPAVRELQRVVDHFEH